MFYNISNHIHINRIKHLIHSYFLFLYRILEDRDPDYQKLAIRGLIGSSKRVLSGTKSEEKIQAIKDGVKILENFLEKFETENFMRNNRAYLAHSIIEQLPKPKNEQSLEFLTAYGGSKAKGNYKHLRTMYPKDDDSTSWDIIRNRNITKLLDKLKSEGAKLFDADNGEPTDIHLELIHWAYSPQPDKVKAYVEKSSKKSAPKRKSDHKASSSSSSAESSSDSDDETPQKKKKSE